MIPIDVSTLLIIAVILVFLGAVTFCFCKSYNRVELPNDL